MLVAPRLRHDLTVAAQEWARGSARPRITPATGADYFSLDRV